MRSYIDTWHYTCVTFLHSSVHENVECNPIIQWWKKEGKHLTESNYMTLILWRIWQPLDFWQGVWISRLFHCRNVYFRWHPIRVYCVGFDPYGLNPFDFSFSFCRAPLWGLPFVWAQWYTRVILRSYTFRAQFKHVEYQIKCCCHWESHRWSN